MDRNEIQGIELIKVKINHPIDIHNTLMQILHREETILLHRQLSRKKAFVFHNMDFL